MHLYFDYKDILYGTYNKNTSGPTICSPELTTNITLNLDQDRVYSANLAAFWQHATFLP